MLHIEWVGRCGRNFGIEVKKEGQIKMELKVG